MRGEVSLSCFTGQGMIHMKKKVLVPVCLAVMCLSGCEIPFLPDVKEIQGSAQEDKQFIRIPREALQVVVGETQMKEVSGSKIATTKIVLTNTSEKNLPIRTNGNVLLEVTARDEKGIKVFERELENEKTFLKPGEQISWDLDMTLLKPGSYGWDIKLMLKSGELGTQKNTIILYHELEKEWQQAFQWNDVQHQFLPQVQQVYVYQMEDGRMQKEAFQFFANGFVQSDIDTVGTNVYYEDATGLYLVSAAAGEHGLSNQLGQPPANRELLVPLPTVKGKRWQVGGVVYRVVDVGQKIETKAQLFQNVTVIEVEKTPRMRFYYQKGFGLVRVDVQTEGDWKEYLSFSGIEYQ